MVPTGGLIIDSVPKVFIAGWSCRPHVSSTYQNSRITEGKQVFSVNHIICTEGVGTGSYPEGMVGLHTFPDARQGLTL